MIVLDTNVVSELTRTEPDLGVRTWVSGLPLSDLFITSITVAEIRYGVSMMPDGRKKRMLNEAVSRMFTRRFSTRTLPFDVAAADVFAEIRCRRKEAGKPILVLDAQIAAITAVRGADLATRNVKDFEGCGITVVNPWDPHS